MFSLEREKDIADESWCSRLASSDCSAHALLSTSASASRKSALRSGRRKYGWERGSKAGRAKFVITEERKSFESSALAAVLFRYLPSGRRK